VGRTRSTFLAALAALLAAASHGCGGTLRVATQPGGGRESSTQVPIHGEALTIHLLSPAHQRSSAPLVLYASGDGGWFGAAVGMFHTLARSGFPVVGVSTKALMHIEQRWSKPLTIAHVVHGYQQIIDAARAMLQLSPDAPVVLTGWSRGASLGVLVADSPDADPNVVGLVAIGLSADEQLDLEAVSDDDNGPAQPDASSRDQRARSIAMYPLLSRMTSKRSVVIQASGDHYLPATQARALFGPDSPTRRFLAIAARNHRFSGGEPAFSAALVEAVAWVSSGREGI
jgi:poly(3-hydroxybutyrate) depolymerase